MSAEPTAVGGVSGDVDDDPAINGDPEAEGDTAIDGDTATGGDMTNRIVACRMSGSLAGSYCS